MHRIRCVSLHPQRLGDFGIARVLKHTMECAKTVVGTPYYLVRSRS